MIYYVWYKFYGWNFSDLFIDEEAAKKHANYIAAVAGLYAKVICETGIIYEVNYSDD